VRILTVDDDEAALEFINTCLGQAGHEVHSARSGREALEALARDETRMVITDCEMPGMSGLELCRSLRSRAGSGYVYVILLTSRGAPRQVAEVLAAGADDFIAKPPDPAELAMRVRTGERILGLETRDVAIFTMAKLAESRDPETGAHLERVRGYCRALADWFVASGQGEYKIGPEYAGLLYETSPLHDIGKVGIPDSILLKPSRLSDREFEIMKTHTTLGAEALGAAAALFPDAGFLRMARDVAASHHERFDGTGYPRRLVGDNIPLCGRIVALADVYDALTSRRVYKNAYGHEVSKSIITEEAGNAFAPEVVQAFLATEQEFVTIHDRFLENAALVA
jgi:putative two-component system response regulator